MNVISEFQKFCRNEFLEEARKDFFTLRRIPSARTCKLLCYYAGLDSVQRESFSDAVASRAAMNLITSANLAEGFTESDSPLKGNTAWKHWTDWNVANGRRFPSVPELRSHAAQVTMDRTKEDSAEPDAELGRLNTSVRGVTADELRKHVRLTFQELFSAKAINRGGGWWLYEGNLRNSAISVSVNYAGRHAQLRYDVTVTPDSQCAKLEKMSYESALGIGGGDWDFIVEDNIDDAMRLLAEFVIYVTTLPQRLPSCCPAHSKV
jgi:hypothetical protein